MSAFSTIALVSGDFVATGGMDMPNLALASFLARRGVEVEVVAHRIAPALAAETNVRFHRVPKPLDSYFLGSPLLDRAGRRVGSRVLARGGRVLVNGGNCRVPDVSWVHYVHAAFAGASGQPGWRRAKRMLERRIELATERTVLAQAKLVIANSERTRRHLIDLAGVASEKVRVVYYGIDGSTFRPAEAEERARIRDQLGLDDRPVLAFVGALGDTRKGFDTLFDAWSRLQRKGWDTTLVVLGRGAQLARWRERATEAGLERSIRFLGFRQDAAAVMRALDGIVAPVRYEAFGQAVHEALCCGLPALVSSDAGVAEKVPAELRALLLEEPESSSELCRRLEAWRADLEQHRTTARAASELLRQRSWDVMAREITQAMER